LRQVKVVLQSMIRSAMLDDLIGSDPMQKLRARKGERNPLPIAMPPKAVPVAPEKITELLASDCGDYRIALVLIVSGGLRRGEALGLCWQAVDFVTGKITVNRQRIPLTGGAFFGPPKSAAGIRTIKLPADVIDELKTHRRATAEGLLRVGVRLTEDHPVCISARRTAQPGHLHEMGEPARDQIAQFAPCPPVATGQQRHSDRGCQQARRAFDDRHDAEHIRARGRSRR
jgi:integrase